jgi:2,5-diamino-6-(ribosylamino)-4(3H)-pyrimidinone 5'-phosphate reductase
MTIYEPLHFPNPPADRPYVFLNMVATIDGKTVSGDRNESVLDLGSKVDHLLMDRIESAADAVLLGAQTIRATPKSWNPKTRIRIAVTRSGRIDYNSQFLSGAGGKAFIATTDESDVAQPDGIEILRFGSGGVDFEALFSHLRRNGVERLLCLGGSETNSEVLRAGLADELFLTIAPKIKLGRDLPTYAGGAPLSRDEMQRFSLIEHHVVGDEVFLRYRRVVGSD